MTQNEILKQYDNIAASYTQGQEDFFNQREDWGRELIQKCIGNIQGKTLVDAGAGSGTDIDLYLEMGVEKVLAFEPSSKMLNLLSDRYTETTVFGKQGAYENIPFGDAVADILVGRFSLHYVFKLDTAYEEICRVLKPGGKAVFLVPHPTDDFFRSEQFSSQIVVSMKLYGDTVTIHYPTHTFSDYFSKFFLKNFTIENFFEYAPPESDDAISSNYPTAMVFSCIKK